MQFDLLSRYLTQNYKCGRPEVKLHKYRIHNVEMYTPATCFLRESPIVGQKSCHYPSLAKCSKKWSFNDWANILPKIGKAKLGAKFGTRNGFAKLIKSSAIFESSIHFYPTVDNE